MLVRPSTSAGLALHDAGAFAAGAGTHARRGFTLFEVGLSLLLVAFGVVSVLMVFPIGIKAEQLARLKLYAGVKAEEIIESFATSSNANPTIEVEAPNTWEVPAGYRPFCPDLEARVVGHRYGIMPLPREIAQRLDSEGDEIQTILNQGGQIYYAQATGATGLEEVTEAAVTKPTDALTQRLVFAVSGYAQNNNVSFLAQKAWPYYEPYPSPPGHGENKAKRNQPGNGFTFDYNGCSIALWEGVGSGGTTDTDPGNGTLDADIKTVFTDGYRPYALGGSNDPTGAEHYLQAALWYCAKKGLSTDYYDPMLASSPRPEAVAKTRAEDFKTTIADDQKWKYVQAMRFLAHAATCMTRWKTLAELGGQPSTGTGVAIAPGTIGAETSPAIILTHDKIVYFHELGLQLAMVYAASQPYDWGAPRPTQRPLFTDYPLIEYDLDPLNTVSGPIALSGANAEQWRPVTARPVRNIGRSYSFPNTPIPATTWGNSAHFTLAKPFAAAERCRQLVFWAADWMAYVDCETAPSAPIDSSKYLFSAPLPSGNFDTRMNECTWPDHHVYAFRNPEKVIAFTDSTVPTWATGSDVSNKRILNGNGEGNDKGTSADNKNRFLGRWGADRNFNGKLDRGTLPVSVRMRAISVSRYNFYDPRLTLKLR